ncbi:MAG TPA: hypothetical protein VH763_16835 [Gemmatimonadales bacterium]
MSRLGAEDQGDVIPLPHRNFVRPAESRTGSVASMCLGLAVGRRDQDEPWYGHDALHASAVLDLPHATVGDRGYGKAAGAVRDRGGRADLDGFWIHLDADVLDAAVMPGVLSPRERGGSPA